MNNKAIDDLILTLDNLLIQLHKKDFRTQELKPEHLKIGLNLSILIETNLLDKQALLDKYSKVFSKLENLNNKFNSLTSNALLTFNFICYYRNAVNSLYSKINSLDFNQSNAYELKVLFDTLKAYAPLFKTYESVLNFDLDEFNTIEYKVLSLDKYTFNSDEGIIDFKKAS